jgi:hypothetical protein
MPEQTELVEEVEGLKTIFSQTAEAIVSVQRKLDGRAGLDGSSSSFDHVSMSETREQALRYSIPRVSINVEFGLRIDAQRKMFLILPRGSRTQRHTHRLLFSLVAVSEPPLSISDSATAMTGAAKLPFYLTEPFFLLLPDEEKALFAQFLRLLADEEKWQSALPASASPLTPEDVNTEIGRFENPDENRERGPVCFRLHTSPASYLIVRVTKKSKNDSVFLFTPEPELGKRPIEIYSIEGDDTPLVSYRPLHLLALAIRSWHEGAPPLSVELSGGLLPDVGLENLQRFAEVMGEGYAQALATLAAQKDDYMPPAFYDLSEVSAELSYSVEYEQSEGDQELNSPRFNFQFGNSDDYMLIQSRAFLRATRRGRAARLEVELAAPEFALSGAAREKFLSYFVSSDSKTVTEIVKDIGREAADNGESSERYESFIKNKNYWRSVVVLLSYRGPMPKQQFLVIWPGLNKSGQLRSFVFTCKRNSGSDELELTDWIMSVEDTLDDVQLTTSAHSEPSAIITTALNTAGVTTEASTAKDADAAGGAPILTSAIVDATVSSLAQERDLSEEQYQVFHNFFHAVRICGRA